MAEKKFNLNTAFDRGFERGWTEGNNPNIDLLHFGLQDQNHEVLGDLYIADDADFILGLQDEFIEGYLEGCEKYKALDKETKARYSLTIKQKENQMTTITTQEYADKLKYLLSTDYVGVITDTQIKMGVSTLQLLIDTLNKGDNQ